MKKILFGALVCTLSLISYSQTQNTFPANGSVGIGTLSPSAKMDVNGNMKVDSTLIIKDSIIVEKDLRTKRKVCGRR